MVSDREKDPKEEFFRRLGLSEYNRDYAYRSYDYYEYMKAVVRQNFSVSYWSTFVAIYTTMALYLVYLVYQVIEIRRMVEFYRKLFDIKVTTTTD